MAKYDKLTEYLNEHERTNIRVSFDDVEIIIGAKLPASAYKYIEWWANGVVEGRHSYGWLNGDWETEDLNLNEKRVSFVKRG